MNDAFSQDDPTASGGLQSDMPAIGAAPPSPRRTPSPLDAMARTMFAGRPAPQPAQPGVSPYAAPGQSQIAPPPQGGQRWTGTTASLLLPKGSPQPPLRFSPYVKSIPTRSPYEWGQPEEYGRLPASFEYPSVLQGVSQFFGQNGSALSIPLALSMGKNTAAFIDGAMKGQEWKAKMAKQKMLDDALKLQMQEEDQHRRYGDTFARYLAINETNDPSKLTKGINGVSIHDALWNDAVQMQDKNMQAMIESGAKIEDIQRYQALRDANLIDLQKANTKAAEQTEDDSKWTGGPSQATAQPLSFGSPLTMRAEGQSPDPTAPLPDPTAAGGPAPAAARTDPEGKPLLDEEGKPLPIPTAEAAAVTTAIKTGQPEAGMQKMYPHEYNKVMLKANENMAKLRNVADSGSSVSPEQAKQLIRQIDPSVLNDAERIASYQDPLGGGQGGQGASPGSKSGQYSDLLAALATKLDPSWNQANYQLQRDFKKDNQVQNVFVRGDSLPVTGQQVLDDLDAWQRKHPGDQGAINWQMVLERAAANDKEAMKLKGDWSTYVFDIQQVLASGRALQGETFHIEEVTPSWTSVESWKNVIKGHALAANSILQGQTSRWQSIGGKGFPGTYTDEARRHTEAIMRMDPTTGAMPGDRVKDADGNEAIYIGANPNDADDPRNYVDPKTWRGKPLWRPNYADPTTVQPQ